MNNYEQPWAKALYRTRGRCNSPKGHYAKRGIKCFLTMTQMQYIWGRDGAEKMDVPSVDRIDNKGDYTLKNCRIIERSLNSSLGAKCREPSRKQMIQAIKTIREVNDSGINHKPVACYFGDELIAMFRSIKEAAAMIGGNDNSITTCCKGRQKTHRGYEWAYLDKGVFTHVKG